MMSWAFHATFLAIFALIYIVQSDDDYYQFMEHEWGKILQLIFSF